MGKYSLVPEKEISGRISRLQAELEKKELDGALIIQSADLYYFSGTAQQCHLYVPREGEPFLAARKSFERARSESPLSQVVPLKSPRQLPEIIAAQGLPTPERLGMELDVVPASLFFRYQAIFPAAEISDLSGEIRLVRALKSRYELTLIREAARVAEGMFHAACDNLREGITELELAALVEAEGRRLGHQGLVKMRAFNQDMFYGHLLSGPEAALPSGVDSPTGGRGLSPRLPAGAGWKRIRRREPVLVDLVAAYAGYHVDQTRTLALGGLPQELIAAHRLAVEIQNEVASRAIPGARANQLFDLAVEMAREAGLDVNFMGYGESKVAFIGHGVGVELDELPVLAKGFDFELKRNMVFALEPKFTFPGVGVVGTENTFVVQAGGAERITLAPDSIAIVP